MTRAELEAYRWQQLEIVGLREQAEACMLRISAAEFADLEGEK